MAEKREQLSVVEIVLQVSKALHFNQVGGMSGKMNFLEQNTTSLDGDSPVESHLLCRVQEVYSEHINTIGACQWTSP